MFITNNFENYLIIFSLFYFYFCNSFLSTFTEKDRRHSSVSDVPLTESNVLRKVASLTLDKHSEPKVVRPKYLPDKLDFRLYQKFEGKAAKDIILSNKKKH